MDAWASYDFTSQIVFHVSSSDFVVYFRSNWSSIAKNDRSRRAIVEHFDSFVNIRLNLTGGRCLLFLIVRCYDRKRFSLRFVFVEKYNYQSPRSNPVDVRRAFFKTYRYWICGTRTISSSDGIINFP